MTNRILFVCLGNICRSPTAEGVLRGIAAREFPGLPLYLDSAGTANYHVGEPPDRRTIAAARRRGYELAGTACAPGSRWPTFRASTYVLAMDRANLAELGRFAPPEVAGAYGPVPGIRAGAGSRTRCRTRTTAATKTSSACSICANPARAACCAGSACAPETRVRAPRGTRTPLISFDYSSRRGPAGPGDDDQTTKGLAAAVAADRAAPASPRCVQALLARRFGTFRARRLGTLRRWRDSRGA